MNDMHNFSKSVENAIEQMHEMRKKATQSRVICRSSVSNNSTKQSKKLPNNFGFLMSNDDILILGLIFILRDDCRDIWLFLALLYILM